MEFHRINFHGSKVNHCHKEKYTMAFSKLTTACFFGCLGNSPVADKQDDTSLQHTKRQMHH